LSAYDAEFAALAEWLDCRIASFDDDLLKPGLAVHPKDFLTERVRLRLDTLPGAFPSWRCS
jgi:hypothetical protein